MTVEHAKTLAELRAIRETVGRVWLDAENLADRCRKSDDMPPGLVALCWLLDDARDVADHVINIQSG